MSNNETPVVRGGRLRKQKALVVVLGGVDNDEIWEMRGGWSRDFFLKKSTPVQIMFGLRMTLTKGVDKGEDLQALVSIDGELIGPRTRQDYVSMLEGASGSRKQDTGYKTFTFNTGRIKAGKHTITIGGFLNTKNRKNEIARVYFRNVMVKVGSFTPP